MCAAWIAAGLVDQGYSAYDRPTRELIRKWKYAQKNDFLVSESVSYLRRSNQTRDLDFIPGRMSAMVVELNDSMF